MSSLFESWGLDQAGQFLKVSYVVFSLSGGPQDFCKAYSQRLTSEYQQSEQNEDA